MTNRRNNLTKLFSAGAALMMVLSPAIPGIAEGSAASSSVQTPEAETQLIFPDGNGHEYNIEELAANRPNEPGKAYLSITSDMHIDIDPSGIEMFYHVFTLQEENGIGFHMDHFELIYFNEGFAFPSVVTEDEIRGWGVDPELPAHGMFDYHCGICTRMPNGKQNSVGAALIVYGTDENGDELSFSGYIPSPILDEAE